MNTLSFFLIFMDVYGSLINIIMAFTVGVSLLYVICAFTVTMYYSEGISCYGEDSERNKKSKKFFNSKGYLPSFGWTFLVATLFVLSALAPSKDTLYLVAASEAGEMVVASPEGKELINDLQEILDVQLEKLKQ